MFQSVSLEHSCCLCQTSLKLPARVIFLLLLPTGAASSARPPLSEEASSPGDPGEAAASCFCFCLLCSKVGKCWSCRGSIYSRHTSNHLVLFLASA